jgi:hypothetical protein
LAKEGRGIAEGEIDILEHATIKYIYFRILNNLTNLQKLNAVFYEKDVIHAVVHTEKNNSLNDTHIEKVVKKPGVSDSFHVNLVSQIASIQTSLDTN